MSENNNSSLILVVMGPSACGKSEIGTELAKNFNCAFLDGDLYHSKTSIQKMESGISLTDADRIPWLERLAQEIKQFGQPKLEFNIAEGSNKVQVVLACSALRKMYRDILRNIQGQQLKVIFIFLDCSKSILEQRISNRQNHFMKVNMLESQLTTLENPVEYDKGPNEFTIRVNGDLSLKEIVKHVNKSVEQFNI